MSLRRAVPHLIHAGIRQFLDIGADIPTVGNTHNVAQQADPQCRVAYIDIDDHTGHWICSLHDQTAPPST